jgi:hypothetical protein
MHSKSLTCRIRSGGHHGRRLVRMAADLRNPVDQGRQMLRQWVVLAPKLDPQAVAYFIADRQAGAAVDLNGIANIGVVHEGFRLIRTEDASRRAALTTRLLLLFRRGSEVRSRYARGSRAQRPHRARVPSEPNLCLDFTKRQFLRLAAVKDRSPDGAQRNPGSRARLVWSRIALRSIRATGSYQTIASVSATGRFPSSESPERTARLPAAKMSCTNPSLPSPRMIRPLMSISYQACEM